VGDIHTLVRSLRGFSRDNEITKAVRVELRKPVPAVRTRIKMAARAQLPRSGGLGDWVAGTQITAKVEFSAKIVKVRLRGGRNSFANLRGTGGARSDIRAIDRGRVRHPFWGRRYRGQWRTQNVQPGFFSKTAEEAPEWGEAIDRAITVALEKIHA